jgi:signal transduction histidine kinase
MFRFSLSGRFVAIAGMAFLATWITIIAFFYWSNSINYRVSLPGPAQLAAIQHLFDSAPSKARPALIAAVTSPILDLQVAMSASSPPGPGTDLANDRDYSAYRDALGAAFVSIRSVAPPPEFSFLTGYFINRINFVTVEARLQTGEILVFHLRNPVIVALFGLPAGMGAGLVGTLFALLAFVFLHREIQPLTRLAAAVDRINPVGAPTPLPEPRRTAAPETRALYLAFNRLQSRLRAIVETRLALIGGMQHDIRTFATRLRLRIDNIPDRLDRERAATDISDMIDLLDNALLATRAGVGSLDEELLDFAALVVEEVRDRVRLGAPVDLKLDPSAREAMVIGDRLALRRIISNVVENALNYGQVAHLRLTTASSSAVLLVDDEGPGIPEALRDNIIEPFVRIEPSRARRTGGAGLGLAVVRSLLEAHGGQLEIADAPRGGARVIVTLPLYAGTQGGR